MKKIYCLLAYIAGISVSGAAMAANNSQVTFSATITQGTCDFSVVDTSGTAITTLALGNVDATSLIGTNQKTTTPTAFKLRSACKGLGPASAGAPSVSLTGTALGTGTESKKLFRDTADSTSKGLGIAVATGTGTTVTWSNIKGNGDTVPTTLNYSGTTTATNNDVDMLAAVACGATADCANTNLGAGTLSAKITFTLTAP